MKKCCDRWPEYDGRNLRCPVCLRWSPFLSWETKLESTPVEKQLRALEEFRLVGCYTEMVSRALCIPMGPFTMKVEFRIFKSEMNEIRKVMARNLQQAHHAVQVQQQKDEQIRQQIMKGF